MFSDSVIFTTLQKVAMMQALTDTRMVVCFRASRDGWSSYTLWNMCGYRGG